MARRTLVDHRTLSGRAIRTLRLTMLVANEHAYVAAGSARALRPRSCTLIENQCGQRRSVPDIELDVDIVQVNTHRTC